MKDIIFYTFRTNKFIEEFQKNGIPVFVFDKIKTDFENFCELIKKEKPKLIIGLGVSNRTRIEPITINAFGNGKVSKNGKETYKLEIPKNLDLPIAKHPTNSFCNWTAYKISEYCECSERNKVKVVFIHFKRTDIKDIFLRCQRL